MRSVRPQAAREVYRGTSGRRAACICSGLFATGIGLDRDRAFYPVVTIVITSYCALFAVMGASMHALVLESLVGTVFLAAAIQSRRADLVATSLTTANRTRRSGRYHLITGRQHDALGRLKVRS